jgi:photosystem II stability/assembly factor-like uncharacterized protein
MRRVAAEEYSVESAKASQSLLIGATHAGKRLVVVGDRGHILFSDDQGKTWTQARVPTRQLLTAVFFLDDKRGWAVGHDAQILASSDGGATWSKFEDLPRSPVARCRFLDPQHGFAVGAYGALLETTDGGQHWQDVASAWTTPTSCTSTPSPWCKDAGLFIVGEQGSMFRSSDNGQTWEKVQGPYEGSLFGVIGTAQPTPCWPTACAATCSAPPISVTAGSRSNSPRGPLNSAWQALRFSMTAAWCWSATAAACCAAPTTARPSACSTAPTASPWPVSGLANGGLLLVGQGGVHLASAEGARRCAHDQQESITTCITRTRPRCSNA